MSSFIEPWVGLVWITNSDPTIAPGVAAPLWQPLIRTDDQTLYYKSGNLPTDWTPLNGGGGGGGGVIVDWEGVPILSPATTLNFSDVALIASDAGGGVAKLTSNPPYVDLRLPPYNLVANDPTKAAQNTAGIKAAIIAFDGTYANLATGNGDYYFDRDGVSNASIAVKGVSKLTFSGQGSQATRWIQQGDAAFGEWNLFVVDGSHDIELYGIQLLQGTITNSDPTQENHLIANYNSGTGTDNIRYHDFACGKCIGDAFRVFSNAIGDAVTNVSAINFWMSLHGIVDPATARVGARSGIALQRGYDTVEFGGFYIAGTQNEAIDMEPSGGPGTVLNGAYFHDFFIDGTISAVDVDISWGGASAGDLATNCRVINGQLLNGATTILSTAGFELDGFTIISSILFGTPATPLLTVRQINNSFKLSNLNLQRLVGSGAGPVLDIENAGDSTQVLDFDIRQETAVTSTHFDGCANTRLRGKITDTAGGAGSRDGIEFFAVVANANFPQVDGLQVISTNTLQSAIGFYPRTPNQMHRILVDNVMANNTFYGVLFSFGTGSSFDPNPTITNINAGANEMWRAENQGAAAIDTVFPCIGGGQGTNQAARYPVPRMLIGNVTPNGNAVGNLGDIYRWCPSSTTAETWEKSSQAVAGTPDNTSWAKLVPAGGASGTQEYRYVATGAENPAGFPIPLQTTRADANYNAVAALGITSDGFGGVGGYTTQCPPSGYTNTQFTCIPGAQPLAGDILLITITPLT